VIILTFGGTVPAKLLRNMIITAYLVKVGYEVLATPLTYLVINGLKRSENVDTFDYEESFNPFKF